ncbi:uncharacterized protein LOC123536352 [Mercenaria mercenaria]|uniref:uncharacterized protein LOC123536352 n=1 Tax=Mercenaria mercenaria TaxID=6596 RepID=UPI00234E3A1A|nr:uncharacterized protein LOC123536352 [Mercenaria mercenaria]
MSERVLRLGITHLELKFKSMGNSGSTIDMNSPEGQFITSEIQSNCVVIFSKTSCSYCRATKNLCQKIGVNARVIELDRRQDGSDVQNLLGAITGASTVPRVFINGKCVGGNSEFQKLNKSGKLAELLAECGNT